VTDTERRVVHHFIDRIKEYCDMCDIAGKSTEVNMRDIVHMTAKWAVEAHRESMEEAKG
jgi:hypothetical protein